MSEVLLTISEAAKIMCVCNNTLRDWDISGKFKASRTIGGHRRYTIDQIREYLVENPIEDELVKRSEQDDAIYSTSATEANQLKELTEKWDSVGYLDECKSDIEKRQLAIILETCRISCEVEFHERILSTSQTLWLTQQGWLRSKLRKIVSVQPLSGPCGLIFCLNENLKGKAIDSQAVAAKTQMYNFTVYRKANFDTVKELYADAMADEIDDFIFQKMPNRCNLDTLLDATFESDICLKDTYDYIAGPGEHLDILAKRHSSKGVDLFKTSTMLDRDSFRVLAVAGRYPKNFDLPVFSPYILLSEGMSRVGSVGKMRMRAGWYDEESEKPTTIDISTGLKIEPEPGTVITN